MPGSTQPVAQWKYILAKIEIWFHRAAMAHKRDHIELSKDALNRRWQYQKELAELEGKEPPAPPRDPDYYFGRRYNTSQGYGPGFGRPGGDPDQPAPVPRRPLPDAGAGEIELPLPEPFPEAGI